MLVKNVFIRCARWKLAEPYQCRFPDSPSAWLWNHLCNLATGTFNCCYPADGNLVYSRDTISRFEHNVTTGTTKRLGGKQHVTVILKTLDFSAHWVHIAENSWTDIFAKPFERWRKKIRLNQILPLKNRLCFYRVHWFPPHHSHAVTDSCNPQTVTKVYSNAEATPNIERLGPYQLGKSAHSGENTSDHHLLLLFFFDLLVSKGVSDFTVAISRCAMGPPTTTHFFVTIGKGIDTTCAFRMSVQ